MDPATIVAIITAAAQIVKAAAPLIEKADDIFGSEDANAIRTAAEELREANLALEARVQDKLRGTS